MRDRFGKFAEWWPQQNFWRYLWVPVLISVGLTEVIVAGMSTLLVGQVDHGYLLTGAVASVLVSLAVSAALLYLAHRVEGRLQDEYAFRRKLMDSIPGVFYLLDEVGRFLLWNQNVEGVLEMRPDEIAAANALQFFDAHDRPRIESAIREALTTGKTSVEAVLCAKSGKRTPYYFNGFRFDVEGKPAVLGMGVDVSGRHQAEAELIEAKDRLALALEASSLSIWDFDIKSGIVYLDGRWADMIGALPGVSIMPASGLLELTHPDDRERILRSVISAFKGTTSYFQEEFRFKTASGEWKWIRCSGKVAERDAEGRAIRAIGTNLDSTEHKAAEARIHQLAYYDSLTGLPNRSLLMDRLNQALSQARRFGRSLAIMFLDLDDFKRVNDTLGHFAGDELLKEAGRRLVGCIRTGDTLSRQGGDEFVVILAEISRPEDAERVAAKIVRTMAPPFHIAGENLKITVSIGISVYPVNGADDIHELMKKADIAMYAAKKAGRNRYVFHSPAATIGS